jgi:hypothetical protein
MGMPNVIRFTIACPPRDLKAHKDTRFCIRCSGALGEAHRLKRALRGRFRRSRAEVTGLWRKMHVEELLVIAVITARRMVCGLNRNEKEAWNVVNDTNSLEEYY